MKKVLSFIIVLFSFIYCCSVKAQTDLIPLQDAENYKGMSIIPEKTKNTGLLINMAMLYPNDNATNYYFKLTCKECYIILVKPYNKTQNGVSNILTIYNDRNINYLINNYDYETNQSDLTINNLLNRFCSVKCSNMNNNTIALINNSNLFYKDNNISLTNQYTMNCLIYFPVIDVNTSLEFNNARWGNFMTDIIINYLWLYEYEGIYSYYNCNQFSLSNEIVSYNFGYNAIEKNVGVLQCGSDIKDLLPTLSNFSYDGMSYSMFQMSYLYGFLTSSNNKSFSNNLNGYVDLYCFGNNIGAYSTSIYNNNNIYYYDDTNGSISDTYFNTNFKTFSYFYSVHINSYHGDSYINFDNLVINNNNLAASSYFKSNNDYYQQDVGETTNTDLAADLGIKYINCDWWNLKGQLNNLIYYIITGVPFINKIYSFNSTIIGPLSLGFTTFLSFSPILLSIIGLVCAIKIFFKMLD